VKRAASHPGQERHLLSLPCADLRAPANLLKQINLIWVVQSPLQKYFASPVGQIISTNSRHPTPQEGRIMIVTNAGWVAVDAAAFLRAMGSQGWSKDL